MVMTWTSVFFIHWTQSFKWCIPLPRAKPIFGCTFCLLSRFCWSALNSNTYTCGSLWILKLVASSFSLSPVLHFPYLARGFAANAMGVPLGCMELTCVMTLNRVHFLELNWLFLLRSWGTILFHSQDKSLPLIFIILCSKISLCKNADIIHYCRINLFSCVMSLF